MTKRPTRVVEIPDTWLGGCLRTDTNCTEWSDAIEILGSVGTAFPEIAEFALHAASVTNGDPGASAEEALNALNLARTDRAETPMDPLHLVGIIHQAMASTKRIRCEGILSNWEPEIAEALCKSAAGTDGMRSVHDRKTFFTMRGLLRPVSASVNIDARRMAPKADLAGAPAVEAGNLAFQGLLDEGEDSTDQPDGDE